MTIQPINDSALMGGAVQTSYDAARMNAESKSFQATLDELQRKAVSPSDDAAGYVPKNKMTAEEREAQKLREACQGFEAMFLSMMYKQMRATVPKDGLFGHSNAIDIFEDLRDTELMNSVAKGGGIGIADMMYKQLTIKTR